MFYVYAEKESDDSFVPGPHQFEEFEDSTEALKEAEFLISEGWSVKFIAGTEVKLLEGERVEVCRGNG
jgi:hypothetical protein